MDESDLEAEEPRARLRVDHVRALGAQPLELLVEVVDPVRDVVHARPALGEKLADRRLGPERREELDGRVADPHGGRLDPLGGHGVPMGELRGEDAAVRLERGVEVVDRDAEVVDAAERHAGMVTAGPYTHGMLPVPAHFDPNAVDSVWRVPYEERAREAEAWAAAHGIGPAADDERRVALVVVDVQNTFCTPGFELFVAGRSGRAAVDDSRRLCEFLYRHLGEITEIVATLDTHQAYQIFHAAYLVDDEGRHPDPYTLVSVDDVDGGRWRVDDRACAALGLDVEYARRQLDAYVRALADGGKYELTIWPYHAMLGGIGHALVSAVEEAIFFHSIARSSQPRFEAKGSRPLTEHYSVLGPEVEHGPDGELLGTRNDALIEHLLSFDAVVVAGQAKSHCVAWTIDDLLGAAGGPAGELAREVYLLEDCTSPVVVPGVVDYTDDADAAFARFAAAGMHVVRSTESPMRWLSDAAARVS
jgi:nicotinamidase-related amidase